MVGQPSVVNVLEAGLRASDLRRKVIANNIANIETPGFRRSAVRFEDLLAEALESSEPGDLAEIRGEIFQPGNTPVNAKGNDVNIEVEMGDLIKTSTRQKAYLRMLNKVYKQMELAMRDKV